MIVDWNNNLNEERSKPDTLPAFLGSNSGSEEFPFTLRETVADIGYFASYISAERFDTMSKQGLASMKNQAPAAVTIRISGKDRREILIIKNESLKPLTN